jgi:hypothetical protein
LSGTKSMSQRLQEMREANYERQEKRLREMEKAKSQPKKKPGKKP